ncbi:MAG: metal ABC transporter permease [Patescibacteria group bacterium]|nr:metal ABC transporter permease [Patescibacteria group bacterium]
MFENFPLILISGIAVATASGLIGTFLVVRKMTLMSDALSHVALPGIALGIIFNFQPLVGGVVFLFFGILLIWKIENKTKLAIESITGVLFVTTLAVGTLLIPETELLETFFGSVEKTTSFQLILQTIIAVIVIATALKYLKPLTLSSVAPDLAASEKISHAKMQFLLLTLITLTISIGISFVGVLLISALSIVPAATARNLSDNFKLFIRLSVILAIFSLTGGLYISHVWHFDPGIATVLISAFFFVLSLFKKQ